MNREDIVLVIYINVGQKSIEDASVYVERVKKDIESKTDKFTVFYVPTRRDDSRIECINPIILDKKDYATKVSKILVDYEIKLNEFMTKPEPKKKVAKVPIGNDPFYGYVKDNVKSTIPDLPKITKPKTPKVVTQPPVKEVITPAPEPPKVTKPKTPKTRSK